MGLTAHRVRHGMQTCTLAPIETARRAMQTSWIQNLSIRDNIL